MSQIVKTIVTIAIIAKFTVGKTFAIELEAL
jgi:hypothetical protein